MPHSNILQPWFVAVVDAKGYLIAAKRSRKSAHGAAFTFGRCQRRANSGLSAREVFKVRAI